MKGGVDSPAYESASRVRVFTVRTIGFARAIKPGDATRATARATPRGLRESQSPDHSGFASFAIDRLFLPSGVPRVLQGFAAILDERAAALTTAGEFLRAHVTRPRS